MADDSHLDLKYFINGAIYNCPFCNRRHVSYSIEGWNQFHWSNSKICEVWRVKCNSCQKISMHLTFDKLNDTATSLLRFKKDADLDAAFFIPFLLLFSLSIPEFHL